MISSCKRCSAELPNDALVCKACHTLVYSEELEQLSASARMLEDQRDMVHAKEQWLKMTEKLPANSKQTVWIQEHVKRLELLPPLPAPSPPKSKWLKPLAPIAPILLALSKGKALLALFNLKFILSLGAFLGVYWSLYGIKFGLGFTAQILLHELGHYIDIKRRGLPADMPVFLPGMGAFVRWAAFGVSLETRAAVSLAGPLAGFIAAAVCAFIGFATGSGMWSALARAGAWLNLLNLIPVWGLDGGHAFMAISRRHRGMILACAGLFLIFFGESMLLLIALGATARMFTKDLPETPSTFATIYFVTVLSALSGLLWLVPGKGFGLP